MTSTGSVVLTDRDYALGRRCPRRLLARISARGRSSAGGVAAPAPDRPENLEEIHACLQDAEAMQATWRRLTNARFDEATTPEGIRALPRIRVPSPGGWMLIEPISRTTIRPSALDRLALVSGVFRACDVPVDRVSILSVNKQYQRGEFLSFDELFEWTDCTTAVFDRIHSTVARARRLLELARRAEDPGSCGDKRCPLCRTPRGNREIDDPETLVHGRDQKLRHISSLHEIADASVLRHEQAVQVKAVQQNRPQVNHSELQRFLASCRYPRVFLDFESVNVAIPPFEGIAAWEHVPFQFSVHRQQGPRAPLERAGFLACGEKDWRQEIVGRLLSEVVGAESVVVYGRGLESRSLHRLAETFPVHSASLRACADRIVDLQTPFRKFWYYHPEQRGKMGLKAVSRALLGTGHEELEIQNGLEASMEFWYRVAAPVLRKEIHFAGNGYVDSCGWPGENGGDARETARENLLAYSEMDTAVLVQILAELERVTGLALSTG